jgi:hypothetical protein
MMYGTRKELNKKLKRAFGDNEKFALLVWTRETIAGAAEDMTEQEAESILEQIGSTGGGDHAEEGISFATVLELLAGLRSAPAGQGAAATPPGDFITQVAGTRHEFNKLAAWEAGMVLKRGDTYQDVVAVDYNGSLVTVRNENDRIAMVSPRELLTDDVELFKRSEKILAAGAVVRFTVTDRNRGQAANQKFTVEKVTDSGDIVLQGADGKKTINPVQVRAEQHLDYAWAITGYGAQGASEGAVLALEGTEGSRQAMAHKRAFYISLSRAKQHVQVYTDGTEKWVKSIKRTEYDLKTAHDALSPQTERKQAKVIWAMGQPVGKTAIGRAWSRHEAMGEHNLIAKVIPATRRFPDPSLALPLYDNNGRSAGLALVSLVASDTGRLMRGDVRMVATQGATGAVMQRSRSGNTHVVRTADEAFKAVR